MSQSARDALVLALSLAVTAVLLAVILARGTNPAPPDVAFPLPSTDQLVAVLSIELSTSGGGIAGSLKAVTIVPGSGPKVYGASGPWAVQVISSDGSEIVARFLDPRVVEAETGGSTPFAVRTAVDNVIWDIALPLHLNGAPLDVREIHITAPELTPIYLRAVLDVQERLTSLMPVAMASFATATTPPD